MTDLVKMLDDLEALERQATGAPWKATPEPSDACCWESHVETADRAEDGEYPCEQVADTFPEDGALIAEARNALPTLIALARLAIEARPLVDAEQSDGRAEWRRKFDAIAEERRRAT